MPKLISPSIQYKEGFIQAQIDRHNLGEKIRGFDGHLLKQAGSFTHYINWLNSDFPRYLQHLTLKQFPDNYPFVPQQDFWLVDQNNFLGRSTLRFHLTPKLQKTGGHIGYYINPLFRGQSYGTLLLKLSLNQAAKKGITPVLLTTSKPNLASQKIIHKNGAKLVNSKGKMLYYHFKK